MSEKREPSHIILLRKKGKKTNKVELFDKNLFAKGLSYNGKWRIRVNGKWFPKNELAFYTRTQISNMIFKGIN